MNPKKALIAVLIIALIVISIITFLIISSRRVVVIQVPSRQQKEAEPLQVSTSTNVVQKAIKKEPTTKEIQEKAEQAQERILKGEYTQNDADYLLRPRKKVEEEYAKTTKK